MAPRPWLPLALAPFLLTLGCTAAPEGPAAEDAGDPEPLAIPPDEGPAPPPEPFHAEGVVFLPPSSGQERVVTTLPFEVNATGMRGQVATRLGFSMLLEWPAGTADVVVRVLDPAGEVLAEGALRGLEREAAFDLPDLAEGPHALELRSFGGSDQQANGDYVAWSVHVA